MKQFKSMNWLGVALALLVPSLAVAALTIPNTFAAGDPVSASEMNENFAAIKAKVDELEVLTTGNTKIAVNGINGPFNVAATSYTKVPFLNETVDDNDEFNLGTNVFTAAKSGDYEVCVSFRRTEVQVYNLELYVDNAYFGGLLRGESAQLIANGCRTVRLSAGQDLDVRIYAAGALSVTSDPWDWMTITQLR